MQAARRYPCSSEIIQLQYLRMLLPEWRSRKEKERLAIYTAMESTCLLVCIIRRFPLSRPHLRHTLCFKDSNFANPFPFLLLQSYHFPLRSQPKPNHFNHDDCSIESTRRHGWTSPDARCGRSDCPRRTRQAVYEVSHWIQLHVGTT